MRSFESFLYVFPALYARQTGRSYQKTKTLGGLQNYSVPRSLIDGKPGFAHTALCPEILHHKAVVDAILTPTGILIRTIKPIQFPIP